MLVEQLMIPLYKDNVTKNKVCYDAISLLYCNLANTDIHAMSVFKVKKYIIPCPSLKQIHFSVIWIHSRSKSMNITLISLYHHDRWGRSILYKTTINTDS